MENLLMNVDVRQESDNAGGRSERRSQGWRAGGRAAHYLLSSGERVLQLRSATASRAPESPQALRAARDYLGLSWSISGTDRRLSLRAR